MRGTGRRGSAHVRAVFLAAALLSATFASVTPSAATVAQVQASGSLTGGWCPTDTTYFWYTVTFSGGESEVTAPVVNGSYSASVPVDSTSVTVWCRDNRFAMVGYKVTNSGLALTGDTVLDLTLPDPVVLGFQVFSSPGVPLPGAAFYVSQECVGLAQVVLAPGLTAVSGCQKALAMTSDGEGKASVQVMPTPVIAEVGIANPVVSGYSAVGTVRNVEVVQDKTIDLVVGTSAKPVVVEPPAPPDGLSNGDAGPSSTGDYPANQPVASASLTDAWLSWKAPSITGGLPVSGYRVTVDGVPGVTRTSSPRVTLPSLTVGGTYTVRVRAVNAVGPSLTSASFAFTAKTDDAAPVSAATQTPSPNAAGWNRSAVTVYWHWSDSGG